MAIHGVKRLGEDQAMTDGKLLLRPQEAADALGISRARLYQLLATGELGSVKLGASRRVPTVELDAFVQRLRFDHGNDASENHTTLAVGTA